MTPSPALAKPYEAFAEAHPRKNPVVVWTQHDRVEVDAAPLIQDAL
jgi:hypothetical protein